MRNQYDVTEIVRNKQSYDVVDEFGREATDSHVGIDITNRDKTKRCPGSNQKSPRPDGDKSFNLGQVQTSN